MISTLTIIGSPSSCQGRYDPDNINCASRTDCGHLPIWCNNLPGAELRTTPYNYVLCRRCSNAQLQTRIGICGCDRRWSRITGQASVANKARRPEQPREWEGFKRSTRATFEGNRSIIWKDSPIPWAFLFSTWVTLTPCRYRFRCGLGKSLETTTLPSKTLVIQTVKQ